MYAYVDKPLSRKWSFILLPLVGAGLSDLLLTGYGKGKMVTLFKWGNLVDPTLASDEVMFYAP